MQLSGLFMFCWAECLCGGLFVCMGGDCQGIAWMCWGPFFSLSRVRMPSMRTHLALLALLSLSFCQMLSSKPTLKNFSLLSTEENPELQKVHTYSNKKIAWYYQSLIFLPENKSSARLAIFTFLGKVFSIRIIILIVLIFIALIFMNIFIIAINCHLQRGQYNYWQGFGSDG